MSSLPNWSKVRSINSRHCYSSRMSPGSRRALRPPRPPSARSHGVLFLFIEVRNHYVGAFARIGNRNRPADAAVAARNQRDFVLQSARARDTNPRRDRASGSSLFLCRAAQFSPAPVRRFVPDLARVNFLGRDRGGGGLRHTSVRLLTPALASRRLTVIRDDFPNRLDHDFRLVQMHPMPTPLAVMCRPRCDEAAMADAPQLAPVSDGRRK